MWARDYNEVKALGGKSNSRRTAEQTQIASFWEATLPPIYNGIVLSVANAPGREVTQNARLFAAVAQAADDALLAVFEAKYHYNFWRPVTAIRNGDLDGNDATERDASWTPFIETPMHPEYPCAHCTVAGAVGTVLQAEIGTGSMPTLTTTSYLVKGPARNWTKIDDFMQEVGNARVYDGVHFRNSTEVGTAMGKQIGALAVAKFLRGNGSGATKRDNKPNPSAAATAQHTLGAENLWARGSAARRSETLMPQRFHPVLWALATALLVAQTPAAAQATQSVAADLRMAQDAEPFRRTADAFVASALAGDAAQAQAMLSPALVSRSGEATIRRALDTQILPFFARGKAPGRSVTVTRTTDAAGQQGYAFYMWLQAADASTQRPFTVYVVEEQGRFTVANVVPDRLVEGRHR